MLPMTNAQMNKGDERLQRQGYSRGKITVQKSKGQVMRANRTETKQLTVVAAVVVELLLLQVNDVRADRVEEALVVK